MVRWPISGRGMHNAQEGPAQQRATLTTIRSGLASKEVYEHPVMPSSLEPRQIQHTPHQQYRLLPLQSPGCITSPSLTVLGDWMIDKGSTAELHNPGLGRFPSHPDFNFLQGTCRQRLTPSDVRLILTSVHVSASHKKLDG